MARSTSCIALIFTSQSTFITHFGVDPSLHRNSQHETFSAKFNLRIYYPPPYERLVWLYKHANTDLIESAIEYFNRKKAFSNLDINKQMSVFNDIVMIVFKNFIQHETIACDDQKSSMDE